MGWALDVDGRPTTSPDAALRASLLPLGGTEEAAGYKGYGLGLVVDMLTGVLGGGTPGPLITPLFSPGIGNSDITQTFIVIDPDAIAEPGEFVARMERELELLKAARLAPDAPAAPAPRRPRGGGRAPHHGARLDHRQRPLPEPALPVRPLAGPPAGVTRGRVRHDPLA